MFNYSLNIVVIIKEVIITFELFYDCQNLLLGIIIQSLFHSTMILITPNQLMRY